MKRNHENDNHNLSELNSTLVLVMDTATQNQNFLIDVSKKFIVIPVAHLNKMDNGLPLITPRNWYCQDIYLLLYLIITTCCQGRNSCPILQVGKF